MKLATFEYGGTEAWGFVLNHPKENRLWVYEPAKVEAQLQNSATPTNGFAVSMPRFMTDGGWPETLPDFLALEERGMAALEKLAGFTRTFLDQSDEARMEYCGHPLDGVQLLSPVPRPRLMWGLVQNCPTFIKFNPRRNAANLFPQGHQRPQGAILGHGQHFVQPENTGAIAYNVELGVVIGKQGCYIPIDRAMDYVAGYTVVIDSQINGYYPLVDRDVAGTYAMGAKYDWYVDATCSWGGKMADAHCTAGPWITTPDEVGNPYDLLAYTLKSGKLRDRSHTAALLLSVERTIQWYSSFATLYPGDIIHMGTMGTDGVRCPAECPFNGPEDTVEAKIERIGSVSSPVLNLQQGDWRNADDETYATSLSPAVRALMRGGQTEISIDAWTVESARHFFTVFKNYKSVDTAEGFTPLPTPRFLAAPNSALGRSGACVELPPRTENLTVALELAFVLRKLAKQVKSEEAEAYILGYMPMISLTDSSFGDFLINPATLQEKGLPAVYGRWADHFNCVADMPVPMRWGSVSNLPMHLCVEEVGEAAGNTDEYVAAAPQALAFMCSYISMFPGDVITLGGVSKKIKIPKESITDGMKITGTIGSLGQVEITLARSKSDRNDLAVNQLNLTGKKP